MSYINDDPGLAYLWDPEWPYNCEDPLRELIAGQRVIVAHINTIEVCLEKMADQKSSQDTEDKEDTKTD